MSWKYLKLNNIIKVLCSSKGNLEMFKSLAKTDSGRLSPIGRAIVAQLLKDGIPQSKIARLLDITPAAVSYHA